jgi:hypothetical protein
MCIVAALPRVIKAKPPEKSPVLLDYTEQSKEYLPWCLVIPIQNSPFFPSKLYCWDPLLAFIAMLGSFCLSFSVPPMIWSESFPPNPGRGFCSSNFVKNIPGKSDADVSQRSEKRSRYA